jgi:predicted GNAT family acetyltransferase
MDFIIGDNSIIYNQNGRILGEIEFPSSDEATVDICHTHVDKSQQGRGIAGRLVELAAQELRRTNRKAHVSCSYAIKWFKQHPGYEDILL